MKQREFHSLLIGGLSCGSVATLPGLAQPVFPADGSRLRFALTAKQNYRGTLGVLGEYLQSFDPRLVGLTGTPVQIAAAAKAVQIRIGLRLLALLGPATRPL
jgi:hypothetical protein